MSDTKIRAIDLKEFLQSKINEYLKDKDNSEILQYYRSKYHRIKGAESEKTRSAPPVKESVE